MAGVASTSNTTYSSYDPNKNYTAPLTVVTTLFFMWAVATNLNDILIPHLKKACDLTDFQSSLVQSAFFLGYFLLSLPAGKIIKKVGYKNGILIGLICCAIGALLFVPAATTRVYGMFLMALFVIAGGISFLQVAANPYVSVLGNPATASSRLNLAQAFNSLGATVGPYIGAKLILSEAEKTAEELASMSSQQLEAYRMAEAGMVIVPYIGLALVFLAIAALIYFSNLPKIADDLADENTLDYTQAQQANKESVFNYKHLLMGVMAIFLYVGAEVGIGSFIIRYMQYLKIDDITIDFLSFSISTDISKIITEKHAATFVSIYMFFAMVGRFAGSFLMQKIEPSKILGINAVLASLFCISTIFSSGIMAVLVLVMIGLFNSIMFPTIFTLSINKLGPYTKDGSSLLIMAIVGGGVVPPLMGLISDAKNIQLSFIIPAICYLYIMYFGFKGSSTAYLDKK